MRGFFYGVILSPFLLAFIGLSFQYWWVPTLAVAALAATFAYHYRRADQVVKELEAPIKERFRLARERELSIEATEAMKPKQPEGNVTFLSGGQIRNR